MGSQWCDARACVSYVLCMCVWYSLPRGHDYSLSTFILFGRHGEFIDLCCQLIASAKSSDIVIVV